MTDKIRTPRIRYGRLFINTALEKTRVQNEMEAVVEGAPANYLELLHLPPEIQVRWLPRARPGVAFVHLFCRDAMTMEKKLAQFRKQIAPDGIVWVSWPKKASGVQSHITEDTVRACALPLGFVDVKVCAVDDVWSGLKLSIRKSER